MFNIIARKTLLEYCKTYPKAANALMEWYHEMITKNFTSFQELKHMYGNASLAGDDRVVFNISGNKYRLVVRILFEYKVIQIKMVSAILNRRKPVTLELAKIFFRELGIPAEVLLS